MPDKTALKPQAGLLPEAGPLPEPPLAVSVRTWPYVLAVLLLPVIVLWCQDNTLFTGVGYLDPWFYLGFFRNLANFKGSVFPFSYYGSRLSWILPGALIHSLFSPLAANCILHLAVQSLATVSLFTTIRIAAGARRAFLATMVFSVNPWLWIATGGDYVDGVGIAYYLLAMALLTSAAARPVKRWTLLAAGMALAALVYTNLFWVALAPLLPLYYIALAWMWHRTPPIRSFLSLCLWFGTGCVIVTGVLGGINRLLDGHFWFYAPSVLFALSLVGRKSQWFQSIWAGHVLGPWLWYAAIAASTGLVLIPYRLKRRLTGSNAAGVLLAAQLLLALALMGYMQYRGSSVLGLPYYASYLLPFAFLVIGTSFWPAAEKISQARYVLICCIAAGVFGAIWYDYATLILPTWQSAIRQVLAGGCLLALGLALRQRTVGILAAIAGLAIFTSLARYGMPTDPHAYRRQYETLMRARERIETIRNGHYVRFWFDAHDPDVQDFDALSSTYLWSLSFWGNRFPELPPDVDVPPGTLFVVLSSSRDHVSELARTTLSNCWEPYGMLATPVESDVMEYSSHRYTMELLRAEGDPARWRALRAVFDPNGKGHLQPVEGSVAPAAFPPDLWTGVNEQYVQRVSGGVRLHAPRAPGALVATYPTLVAPTTGRYRFALRYKPGNGEPVFGASIGDGSSWLKASPEGRPVEADHEVDFWVDLKSGQGIHLGIMNDTEKPPASYLMKAVTAVEVLDSEAGIRERPLP